MTQQEKIEYLWTAALERATGAGHKNPFDYADEAARKYYDSLTYTQQLKLARGE